MSNSDEPLSPFRANEDPQAYVLASSLNYTWDVPTLEWVKDTGGGGGSVDGTPFAAELVEIAEAKAKNK